MLTDDFLNIWRISRKGMDTSIPYEEVLKKMSAERRKKIKEKGNKLIKEYESLQAFRKAVGLSQDDLAQRLSIKQENVSRLERRKDMHISSLRKYVEALGGTLEIIITVPDDENQGKKKLTL